MLAAAFEGVRLRDVLELAKPTVAARHVIFEAPGGYTANVRLGEVRGDQNIIAHRYEGRPFSETHGAPVRSIIPDLYFWKSTKWLTGIKLVARDERGYWEQRGYHNHADPWLEERYS